MDVFLLDIPKNRLFFSDSAVSFFLNDDSGIYLPFVIIYAAFFLLPISFPFLFGDGKRPWAFFSFAFAFAFGFLADVAL